MSITHRYSPIVLNTVRLVFGNASGTGVFQVTGRAIVSPLGTFFVLRATHHTPTCAKYCPKTSKDSLTIITNLITRRTSPARFREILYIDWPQYSCLACKTFSAKKGVILKTSTNSLPVIEQKSLPLQSFCWSTLAAAHKSLRCKKSATSDTA